MSHLWRSVSPKIIRPGLVDPLQNRPICCPEKSVITNQLYVTYQKTLILTYIMAEVKSRKTFLAVPATKVYVGVQVYLETQILILAISGLGTQLHVLSALPRGEESLQK
jgi:hypothetical protein